MIVEISDAAESDLGPIGDYIALDNPSRAVSFLAELREACLGLVPMPHRFPLVDGYEDKGVRRRAHGNYAIFYIVSDQRVFIVHILHGSRDHIAVLGNQ